MHIDGGYYTQNCSSLTCKNMYIINNVNTTFAQISCNRVEMSNINLINNTISNVSSQLIYFYDQSSLNISECLSNSNTGAMIRIQNSNFVYIMQHSIINHKGMYLAIHDVNDKANTNSNDLVHFESTKSKLKMNGV